MRRGQVRPGCIVRETGLALLLWAALSLPAAASSAGPVFQNEQEAIARVLRLADERLALMEGVAAWKWQQHRRITDRAREAQVAAHARQLAEPLGISGDSVVSFFRVQMRLARELQINLHERWRAEGFDFSGPIPDLTAELRPALDRLAREQIQALYLAAAHLAGDRNGRQLGRLAAQELRGQQWSRADRRDLVRVLRRLKLEKVPVLSRVAASGILRIGTTGDYAPFSYESDGRLRGADIELALGLAAALNAKPVFVRTSWRSLMDDLQKNRFDLAVGGISITPGRQAAAAFSIPYLQGGKTVIARCSEDSRYAALSAIDQPGVRVIVNPGGTNEQFVRKNLQRATIVVHPDNRTIFEELRAGRADVMITDDIEVELQTRRMPELCRAIPGTLTHAEKAFLLPRDEALITAVNQWLQNRLAAGEPQRLLREALVH